MSQKFALISPVLPPLSSGQAVMLYRILKTLPSDEYTLMSCFRPEIIGSAKSATEPLPAPTVHLKSFSKPDRMTQSLFGKITEPFRYAADIVYRAIQIRKHLKQAGISLLIVCSGDFADMAAGYLVSAISSVSLVPYMFDFFSYQQTGPFRRVATALEKRVAKRAPTIIAPNEQLEKEMHARYDASCTIIRNPCEIPDRSKLKADKKHDEFQIVYTGAVYDAHYDAIVRMLEALDTVPGKAKLHIYTAQDKAELAKHGVVGNNLVLHPHLHHEEIPQIQYNADALFLPLSFEKKYDVLIATSAPGKMGEYLAIGKPILAHVPKNSYVEWYLDKHDAGTVVTEETSEALTRAIATMMQDQKKIKQMGENGLNCAQKDYKISVVQKRFVEMIDGLVR